MLKAVLARIGLCLAAWFLGSAIFGTITDTLIFNSVSLDLRHKADATMEIFGIWVIYRLGAKVFRLTPVRGKRRLPINLTWALFAYLVIGGAAEVAVGHPTAAAGIGGIPCAIAVFLLLTRLPDRPLVEAPRVENSAPV